MSPFDQTCQRSTPRLRRRLPRAWTRGLDAASRRRARSSASEAVFSIPLSSWSSSAPYSSRSRMGSSRSTAACSSPSSSVKRTCRRSDPGDAAPTDDQTRHCFPVTLRDCRIGVVTDLAESNVVRVRVENDDPERRLEEQPLEHGAERVRLSGARLPAEERVPVEATGVEGEPNTGFEEQRPDVERRPRRAGPAPASRRPRPRPPARARPRETARPVRRAARRRRGRPRSAHRRPPAPRPRRARARVSDRGALRSRRSLPPGAGGPGPSSGSVKRRPSSDEAVAPTSASRSRPSLMASSPLDRGARR